MRAATNKKKRRVVFISAVTGLCMACDMACAAEGFKIRFPLAGNLGGEMVAPITPGLFGSVVATQINIDKITGNDGKTFTGSITAGGALRLVSLGLNQQQNNYNLILGYTSTDIYGGGHLTAIVNVPYSTTDRRVNVTSVSDNTSFPSLSNAVSGQTEGVGDIEITGLWSRQTANTKMTVGMTMTLPTGAYDKDVKSINAGYGNFYTLRPGAAFSYKATENLTLGTRASLGFNTKNADNNWRSGDFYVLDLAAAYKTPIGVFGPHILRSEQYRDDVNAVGVTGSLGANRLSSTSAGAFFTTRIPGLDASLNVAYMKTIESRNALSGSLLQVRLAKVF